MTTLVFVEADGRRVAVAARDGESVMLAARRAGVEGIVGECGGGMSCLTCHCFVAPDVAERIAPASEAETALLDCLIEQRKTSRLSCQIVVHPGLEGAVFELPQWQG
ncbi:MAG TPA: 2Fe-2S iron-sulfur cluster-binding protein [Novosphingobium sp.]|nr:2Fe-2S iron-sulfur cluster-binding protein [Novosphingobium sp.]